VHAARCTIRCACRTLRVAAVRVAAVRVVAQVRPATVHLLTAAAEPRRHAWHGTHTHTCIRARTRAHALTQAHAHTHARAHMHMHTRGHARMWGRVRAWVCCRLLAELPPAVCRPVLRRHALAQLHRRGSVRVARTHHKRTRERCSAQVHACMHASMHALVCACVCVCLRVSCTAGVRARGGCGDLPVLGPPAPVDASAASLRPPAHCHRQRPCRLRSVVRSLVRSFVCLFVCSLVCLFARLFVCLFVCLLVCLFVRSRGSAPAGPLRSAPPPSFVITPSRLSKSRHLKVCRSVDAMGRRDGARAYMYKVKERRLPF
jgi:hypothetical protein